MQEIMRESHRTEIRCGAMDMASDNRKKIQKRKYSGQSNGQTKKVNKYIVYEANRKLHEVRMTDCRTC